MTPELFGRVILTRAIPEDGLLAGDVGTVVEIHRDPMGNAIGYEVEAFSASGTTLAVTSVASGDVRLPSEADRLTTRAS